MPASETTDPSQVPPPPTMLPLADPACVGARATVPPPPEMPDVPAASGEDDRGPEAG